MSYCQRTTQLAIFIVLIVGFFIAQQEQLLFQGILIFIVCHL